MNRLVAIIALLVALPLTVGAEDGQRSVLSPHYLGPWVGVSFNSPDTQFLAVTPGRDFHEVAFKVSWRLFRKGVIGAIYNIDLIPFAMVTNNPAYAVARNPFPGFGRPYSASEESKFGIGAAPFGLRIDTFPFSTFRPYLSGSVGFLIFNGQVPTLGASSFNFTFDFGGGVEVNFDERWALLGGYKLHHLSNGSRAYENPGIDSNMFYLGANFAH